MAFSPTEAENLRVWLAEKGLAGEDFAARNVGEGHSNVTTLVETGGRRLILRRQPSLRKDAPDALREARYMAKLNAAGVTAPRVLAMAEAGEALEVSFYVMEHVEGLVISGDLPPEFAPHAQAMAEAMIDGLAGIHLADPARVTSRPLEDPEANRRHLESLRALMKPLPEAPRAALEAMAARLAETAPEAGSLRVAHSDYRLGNLMWRPGTPPVLATVLDWELGTIADPRLDLGYLLISYPAPGLPRTPLHDLGRALDQAAFPPVARLLERYARRTGAEPRDLDWFAAFVSWKTGLFYETSRARGEDSYYATDAHLRAFLAHGEARLARRAAEA